MKDNNPIIVSVIIPLYNHEKYIEETVDSVLSQGIDELEVIIIDDGSSDDSYNIASSFSDNRISCFKQENRGAHATLNRGIELARGEFIAVLNSDDVFLPGRLSKCVNFCRQHQKVDAVFTKVEAIDENGNHLYFFDCKPPYNNQGVRSHPDQLIVLDLLGRNLTTTTSNLFCRREVFAEVGFFRSFRYCHDLDWLLRLVYRKHARLMTEPLLKYRFHNTNTIKENLSLVCFEVGIILKDFFVNNQLGGQLPNMSISEVMSEISKSLHFKYIDRMLATLGIVACNKEQWCGLMEKFLAEESNPFRLACVDSISASLQYEKELENSMRINSRLRDELDLLKRKNEMYRHSVSLRIGRVFTWPLRKIGYSRSQHDLL